MTTSTRPRRPNGGGTPPRAPEAAQPAGDESATEGAARRHGATRAAGTRGALPEDAPEPTPAALAVQARATLGEGNKAHLGAIRAVGALLIRGKRLVGHGKYKDWLARECKFSARAAQSFVQIAEGWPAVEAMFASNPQGLADLTYTRCLKLLAGLAREGAAVRPATTPAPHVGAPRPRRPRPPASCRRGVAASMRPGMTTIATIAASMRRRRRPPAATGRIRPDGRSTTAGDPARHPVRAQVRTPRVPTRNRRSPRWRPRPGDHRRRMPGRRGGGSSTPKIAGSSTTCARHFQAGLALARREILGPSDDGDRAARLWAACSGYRFYLAAVVGEDRPENLGECGQCRGRGVGRDGTGCPGCGTTGVEVADVD